MPRRRKVSDIFKDCQLYLLQRTQKLEAERKFRTAGTPIRKYLKDNGKEDPDTGNLVYEFPSAVSIGDGTVYSGVELRKSQGDAYFELDEVKELLQGTRDYARIIKTRTEEYLDTDELYALYQKGKISEPQLRGLMHYPEPTYALWPIEEKDSLDE